VVARPSPVTQLGTCEDGLVQTWQYELQPEAVPELEQQLEWALQRQNAAFAKFWQTGVMPRIAIGLSLAGIALLLLIFALDPNGVAAAWRFFGFALALCVITPIVAVTRAKRVTGKSISKYVRTSLAKQAASFYRKVAAAAPYIAEYWFDGESIRAQVAKLKLDRHYKLRSARLALHGKHVIFLFRFPRSIHPFRFIYVPTDAKRRALLDAFEKLGIVHEEITGPTEGYGSIPEAKARL
jgi:hypothetical protein